MEASNCWCEMSVHKPYSTELGEYGKAAEQAVQNWLFRNGYVISPLPHGAFKWDCLACNDAEKAYVEVERRGSWAHGCFPFDTVHVPVRRIKSGDAWLFVVRDDLNAALLVFFRYIQACAEIEVENKFVPSGEHFRDVPIELCLPIDMLDASARTIAERNRDRVLSLFNYWKNRGCTSDYLRKILGPIEPYGMSTVEYHELLKRADPLRCEHRKSGKRTGTRTLFEI